MLNLQVTVLGKVVAVQDSNTSRLVLTINDGTGEVSVTSWSAGDDNDQVRAALWLLCRSLFEEIVISASMPYISQEMDGLLHMWTGQMLDCSCQRHDWFTILCSHG